MISSRPETIGTPVPTRARFTRAGIKIVLELGPAAIFFIVTWRFNVNMATAAMMVAITMSLGASYLLRGRLPLIPAFTAAAAMIFGTLTLYFHDPIYIKMKPTIINCCLAALFLGRLALGKPLLPAIFDNTLNIDEAGWRKLGLRWSVYFLIMAVVNEIVWRTQSDIVWAGFRTFVTTPLALGFTFLQLPTIRKHRIRPVVPSPGVEAL